MERWCRCADVGTEFIVLKVHSLACQRLAGVSEGRIAWARTLGVLCVQEGPHLFQEWWVVCIAQCCIPWMGSMEHFLILIGASMMAWILSTFNDCWIPRTWHYTWYMVELKKKRIDVNIISVGCPVTPPCLSVPLWFLTWWIKTWYFDDGLLGRIWIKGRIHLYVIPIVEYFQIKESVFMLHSLFDSRVLGVWTSHLCTVTDGIKWLDGGFWVNVRRCYRMVLCVTPQWRQRCAVFASVILRPVCMWAEAKGSIGFLFLS